MAKLNLYGVAELEEITGLPSRDVRAIVNTGIIDAQKVSGVWVVDDDGLEELEQYLADAEDETEDAEEDETEIDDEENDEE